MSRLSCLGIVAWLLGAGCVEVSSKAPPAIAEAPPPSPEDIVLPNGERFGTCPDGSVPRGSPMVKGATATYCATRLLPAVRHGRFVSFYPSGKVLASGVYIMGDPAGEWRTYHENGQVLSQGTYNLGVRDGAWTFRRADGGVVLEETLSRGVRSAWTEYDYEKGALVAFESFRAVPGHGAVSQGNAGRRLANGSFLKGVFNDGKADGVWEEKLSNGTVALQLTMSAGFAEGRFSARWPETGVTSAEGQLLRTLPQGDWVLHYPSGKKLAFLQYEKGVLRRITAYHESGEKRLSGEFLDGAPHATWTLYHRGGAAAMSGVLARGIRQGMWRTADPTGKPIAEGLYENGVLVEGQEVSPVSGSELGLAAPLQDLFEVLALLTAGRGTVEVEQRLIAECMLFGNPAERCLSLDWENTPGVHANDGAAEIERRDKQQDLACAMNNAAACARAGKRAMPKGSAPPAERKKGVAAAAGYYQKACDLSPAETAWKARDATARAMYKGFHSASACVWLGELIAAGEVKSKAQTPADLYRRACDQGVDAGCDALEAAKSKGKPGAKTAPDAKPAPSSPAPLKL